MIVRINYLDRRGGTKHGASISLPAPFSIGEQLRVSRLALTLPLLDLIRLAVRQIGLGDVGQPRCILRSILQRALLLFHKQLVGRTVEVDILLTIYLIELGILSHEGRTQSAKNIIFPSPKQESIKFKISNTVEKVVLEPDDQMPDEAVLFEETYVRAAEGYLVQQGFVVLQLHYAPHGPAHLLGEPRGYLEGYWVFALVGGERGIGWDVHVVARAH